MRTALAIIIVVILVIVALGMATSLQWYRRRHQRQRRLLEVRGQRIVAEVPVTDGLAFFAEDEGAFYWGDRLIPKDEVRGAQLLISSAPLSSVRSTRFPSREERNGSSADPGAIERERWDVSIDLGGDEVLVECGSIRQQVSQEMARTIYESVKRAIETRDQAHHSVS